MSRLRDFREEIGVSQQSFAETLGISIASLARWEKGDASPGRLLMMVVNQIADELRLERPFEGPPLPKAWGLTWRGKRSVRKQKQAD